MASPADTYFAAVDVIDTAFAKTPHTEANLRARSEAVQAAHKQYRKEELILNRATTRFNQHWRSEITTTTTTTTTTPKQAKPEHTMTTTTAIFLKSPSGLCIETDDDVDTKLDTLTGCDEYLTVSRLRDQAKVLIPIDNIASIVVGGSR